MKLNRSDLIRLANSKGIFVSPYTEPEILIQYIEGKAIPKMDDPEGKMRSALASWVLDNWKQIRAQHKGLLDCLACPSAKMVKCFLDNRRELKKRKYLDMEDPWLIKS